MESASNFFQHLFIPGMILLVAIVFILAIKFIGSRYKKCAPDKALIFFGRKYVHHDKEGKSVTLGFKVLNGGGRILMPFVESVQEMSTTAFQVDIDETSIPNKDTVKINVKGVATCKISTNEEDLINAAQNFLGKNEEERNLFVQNILKGHLRSIVGKLDIDSLLRERDKFNQTVIDESGNELKNLGVQLMTLVIQEIDDKEGYIDAMGKKAVAFVKRDADITVAEAAKERDIKVAEAKRDTEISVSNAVREADVVKATNAVKVADAEKDRDVKIADMKVITDTAKAKAEKAMDIQLAEQDKVLKVKQAERDGAEKEAQIAVQEKESLRKEKELIATVIKPAEAAREKTLIEANVGKQKAEIDGDAAAIKITKEATAKKQAQVLEGEGESSKTKAIAFANAEGKERNLLAEALGKEKNLLAEALGKEKNLLAEASGKEKYLLAEAAGTSAMATSLKEMDDKARFILVLDRLPGLVDKFGDAGSKIAEAVFKSVALPFGSIDQIKIVDMGGNGNGLNKLGNVVPETVFNVIKNLKTMGIDIEDLASKFGVNIGELIGMVGDKKDDNTEKSS